VELAMDAVGAAYRFLATEPRDFISIADIRDLMQDAFPRSVVDQALTRINAQRGNNIIPQSNQKILTARDRAAMVRLGNENRLLISMSNFTRN